MRYTEARLTKIAEEMLADLEQDTVDWRDNFDGSLKEPVMLATKFPNHLCNGTMGIAVGMATNMAPHNLNEVLDASLLLLQKEGKEAFAQAIEQALPSFMFEIEQEAKKYDLSDPADQVRFSEEVVRRLLTLDSKLEINSYRDAIIRRYALNAEGINDFLAKKGKEQGIAKFNNSENYQKERKGSFGGAEEELISVIVSHRRVFDAVWPFIQAEHFQNEFYRKLFELTAAVYAEGGLPDPVIMMHHFPEAEDQKKIAALFSRRLEPENQAQLEQLITDAVRTMREFALREKQKTEKDPNELLKLIEEKKRLLRLKIELGD